MSALDIRRDRSLREYRHTQATEADRVACTGYGICASLLPEQITLDERGHPVMLAADIDLELGDIASRLCPARALFWSQRGSEPGGGGRMSPRRRD